MTNGGYVPSLVRYVCDTGYAAATGAMYSICTDGLWSSVGHILCIGIPCKELDPPGNYNYAGLQLVETLGSVAYTNGGRYPSTAKYACDAGYTLAAGHGSTRSCRADGSWSDGFWSCFPPLGNVSYQECCDVGHMRYARPECWSGPWTYDSCCLATPPPTCLGVQCAGNVTAPTNGRVAPASNGGVFPSAVVYACDGGYEFDVAADWSTTSFCRASEVVMLVLDSSRGHRCARRPCSTGGTWEPSDQPTCKPIQCSAVTAPANGVTGSLTNGGTYPSSVWFSCDDGYELVGPAEQRCGPTGTWAAAGCTLSSYCQGIVCDPLPWLAGGTVNATNKRRFPSAATFSCDAGYALKGSRVEYCTAAGNWSGSADAPSCEDCGIDCLACNQISQRGIVSSCGQDQQCCGTGCTLSCATGFTGTPGNATCLPTGNWSGLDSIECWRNCKELPNPGAEFVVYTTGENRSLVSYGDADNATGGETLRHGTSRELMCRQGYMATSAAAKGTKVCSNGAWLSSVDVVCVEFCQPPELLPPDTVASCSTEAVLVGTQCEVSCAARYTGASVSRTCERVGDGIAQWSHETPRCFSPCRLSAVTWLTGVVSANGFATKTSPPSFANVSLLHGEWSDWTVVHGSFLDVGCREGFVAMQMPERVELDTTSTARHVCANGTLLGPTVACMQRSSCLSGTADLDDDPFTPCQLCPHGRYAPIFSLTVSHFIMCY